MDAKALDILRELANLAWVDVAFLIDSEGRVVVSVGTSAAFSHNGEFQYTASDPVDPDTSLYFTAITKAIYLGVLFRAEVGLDDVRSEVSQREVALAQAVSE